MDAVQRRGTPERMQYIKRFGACLLIMVMLLGFVEPPRTKAFAVTGSIAVAAAVFLASCGLTWNVLNASEDTFVDTVGGILNDYLNTEFAGQTLTEWASDIAISAINGKLMFPKLAVGKFADFAQWVVEKYSVTPGSSVQLAEGSYITFADGQTFKLTSISSTGSLDTNTHFFDPDTIVMGDHVPYTDGTVAYQITEDISWTFNCSYSSTDICSFKAYDSKGNLFLFNNNMLLWNPNYFVSFCVYDGYLSLLAGWTAYGKPVYSCYTNIAEVLVNTSLSSIAMGLDKALDIPDTSTMDDDEALAIGAGAAVGVGLEALLQHILDAIRSNELATTQEITKAEEITEPETGTDINKLGLPALGVALTTRFPFSIPWDVYKGIKLLAAPAKTPRFEVDFMAPIAERVGGWKGSTKMVLDFGEYEIIGQVSRWASTIGFCLMLASGTKRLIWTG